MKCLLVTVNLFIYFDSECAIAAFMSTHSWKALERQNLASGFWRSRSDGQRQLVSFASTDLSFQSELGSLASLPVPQFLPA